MPRRGSRPRWWVAGVVVGLALLVGLGWLALCQGLRILAETTLSGILGTPVHVASAWPGWPPVQIGLSGVGVGELEDPTISFDTVRVELDGGPLLRRKVRGLRLALHGSQVHGAEDRRHETLSQVLDRLAVLPLGEDGFRVDSLRVDGLRLGDEHALAVAPFELRDLELARAPSAPLGGTALLDVGGGTARVVAEIEPLDGGSTLRLDTEVSSVPLDRLGAWPSLRMAGEVRGTLSYRRVSGEGVTSRIRASGSVTALSIDAAEGRLLAARTIEVTDLEIAPEARRVSASSCDATGVDLSPALAGRILDGPADVSWDTRLGRVSIRDLGFGSSSALRVERLELRDVDSEAGAGAIDLEARLEGGTIGLVGERSAGEAGRAELHVAALPLAALAEEPGSPVRISTGTLDLRLTLEGPPGLQGRGEAALRDLAVFAKGASDAEDRPLFALADMHVAAGYLSLFPPRVELQSAQLVEPHVWVRFEDGGPEIARLAVGEPSALRPAPWLRSAWTALATRLGEGPAAEHRPPAVGVRLSDGRLVLSDDRTTPPFSLTLSSLNAIVTGPAGPAGPVTAETEAHGGPLGTVRLRGRTGPEESTASGEIGPVELRALDPYLRRWLGLGATSGRLELSFNARLEPNPAANVRLGLDGVRVEQGAEPDPLTRGLGVPLAEVVERIQGDGGRGRLDLALTGSRTAPAYGLLAAFPEALRESVAEAAPR